MTRDRGSDAELTKIARWEWGLVALALVLGAAVRIWLLYHAPGPWAEEATNGLDAVRLIRESGWPIFFEANNGREPMMIYLEALGVLVGGTSTIALRAAGTRMPRLHTSSDGSDIPWFSKNRKK